MKQSGKWTVGSSAIGPSRSTGQNQRMGARIQGMVMVVGVTPPVAGGAAMGEEIGLLGKTIALSVGDPGTGPGTALQPVAVAEVVVDSCLVLGLVGSVVDVGTAMQIGTASLMIDMTGEGTMVIETAMIAETNMGAVIAMLVTGITFWN